ncbi:MAG TPA: tetratricopeptide repeat protein [Bacteroidales bacterium]|nr:tetratricopeptide repeat protein [Bacteroidales bacterium]
MKKSIIFLLICTALQAGYGQGGYDTVLRAIALSSRGERGEAIDILTSEMAGKPTLNVFLTRGDIYLEGSMIKEARADFMSAEGIKQGAGLYGLARCAAAEGNAAEATAYLEAHLKSPYKKSEPEIVLDSSFAKVSSSPEWRALWKKEWYKVSERKKWETEYYLNTGKIDMASEVYATLAAEYPGMPVTEFCGALMAMARGNYGEAVKELEPLTRNGSAPSAWLLKLAEAQAGNGNYNAAASVYNRLISLEYPDASLYLKRAEMKARARDTKAAIEDFQEYLGYYPDDFRALSLLGKTFAEEGAIYEALPYLNTNIEKHPGESQAFSLRGDAWFASHTWDKAVEDYTMSLDLDPESPGVNLNLGMALINCGKAEDACHYLRKAKDLGEKSAAQYLSKYCIK